MSVGFAAAKADYDQRAGGLAMALRDDLARIAAFKAHLDTRTDANLIALGFTQGEVDTLRSAFGDLDQLRTIYEGSVNLSVAKDFRSFAKLLTGVI
jgi:hypothetical protein